jgi:cold shock protein
MATGTVKSFDIQKGFGLILGDDGTEYSVHSSDVESGLTIHRGNKVRFEVANAGRGPRAFRVEINPA